MRLFAVSHSCIVDVNQQLYVSLRRMHGVCVELVVPAVWKNSYSAVPRTVQKLQAVDFPIHALPIRKMGDVSLYHYTQGLTSAFQKARPDVVFVDEEPWSLSMAQMTRLCRQAGIPMVGYTKQNILKLYPPPFRWIERQTYRVASAIAVISEEVSDILRHKGYTGVCPLLVHGCDLALFSPAASRQRRDQLGLKGSVVGYMGRLTPEKGLDTLIAAVRTLKTQEPDTPVSILIIGAGVEEENLRRMAKEAGLESQCVFAGIVPHLHAADYMNCMDIFVLPSRTMPRWKEQFGRVIVEAMACGVPVVGSDSGQIPLLIADTQGGLIFKEGDASDLAAKLSELIADPARRAALGAAGEKAVRRRYTYDAVAQQLYDILANIHAK